MFTVLRFALLAVSALLAVPAAATAAPPQASFTVSPSPAQAGETVTFDASTSSDPDGKALTYFWDWDNDGSHELQTNNPVVTRTFEAGTRSIRLAVDDPDAEYNPAAGSVATVELTVDGAAGGQDEPSDEEDSAANPEGETPPSGGEQDAPSGPQHSRQVQHILDNPFSFGIHGSLVPRGIQLATLAYEPYLRRGDFRRNEKATGLKSSSELRRVGRERAALRRDRYRYWTRPQVEADVVALRGREIYVAPIFTPVSEVDIRRMPGTHWNIGNEVERYLHDIEGGEIVAQRAGTGHGETRPNNPVRVELAVYDPQKNCDLDGKPYGAVAKHFDRFDGGSYRQAIDSLADTYASCRVAIGESVVDSDNRYRGRTLEEPVITNVGRDKDGRGYWINLTVRRPNDKKPEPVPCDYKALEHQVKGKPWEGPGGGRELYQEFQKRNSQCNFEIQFKSKRDIPYPFLAEVIGPAKGKREGTLVVWQPRQPDLMTAVRSQAFRTGSRAGDIVGLDDDWQLTAGARNGIVIKPLDKALSVDNDGQIHEHLRGVRIDVWFDPQGRRENAELLHSERTGANGETRRIVIEPRSAGTVFFEASAGGSESDNGRAVYGWGRIKVVERRGKGCFTGVSGHTWERHDGVFREVTRCGGRLAQGSGFQELVRWLGDLLWGIDDQARSTLSGSGSPEARLRTAASQSRVVPWQGVFGTSLRPDPRPPAVTTQTAQLISTGGGNIIAAGGGNIIATGGGNLISDKGMGIIAAGGGNIIAAGGGNIIAPGGGNIIAAGGGNIIATGGGNIIATGGGNIIATGGGNFSSVNSKVIDFGPNGAALLAGSNIIATGGGN